MSFREWRKGKYSARAVVMDESLAEHDAKYHPNGFDPEKDECKLRESMAKEGAKDDLKSDSIVTAEEDAEYMEAVKNGDMEKAERMVREAAEKAMPDAFVKGSVLHVTDSDFTVFDDSKFGTGIGGGVLGRGFYFSTDGENLPDDGEHTREYFVNVQNPFVFQPEYKPQMKAVLKAIGDYTGKKFDVKNALDDIDAILNHKGAMAYDVADYLTLKFGNDERRDNQTSFRDFLKSFGYDGVYSDSLGELVAFYPSQIKSADPVTYDDAGNVIPLSKRFDSKSNDIRF